jgi:hypothetical protein
MNKAISALALISAINAVKLEGAFNTGFGNVSDPFAALTDALDVIVEEVETAAVDAIEAGNSATDVDVSAIVNDIVADLDVPAEEVAEVIEAIEEEIAEVTGLEVVDAGLTVRAAPAVDEEVDARNNHYYDEDQLNLLAEKIKEAFERAEGADLSARGEIGEILDAAASLISDTTGYRAEKWAFAADEQARTFNEMTPDLQTNRVWEA